MIELGLDKIVDVLFDKITSNIKDIASYQLDKLTYSNMCKEAYNRINNLDQVKTINDFGESISLYDFYVAPMVTAISDKDRSFSVNNLDDFACHKKILISGIVGQGKSILMRHLAIQEAYKGERFPIFTELRELEKDESLESFMRNKVKSWLGTNNDKIASYLIKEGKVIFFFDGFDEVKVINMEKTVKSFEKIQMKYPNLKFVVSSRPEEFIDKSTIFNKFVINKLELDGQLRIIEKLVSDTTIKTNLISTLKKSSKDIHKVLVTPLMVNFYYYLYKTEQIVSNNIKVFYIKLFDLIQRKHDGTKLLYDREYFTKLTDEQIEAVFECLCYLSCRAESFFLKEYMFRDIIQKTIEFNNLNCSVDNLIHDLTTGICLIGKEGESYAFLHTSIAEFFGAQFVIKNQDISGIYDELINNYKKYMNLINYLKVINEKTFYIKFLKPVIEQSLEFFTSKNILKYIYISSKKYNKHYSEKESVAKKENPISCLIIFDKKVHPYIAFNYMSHIEPIIRESMNKKYIYSTGLETEIIYNSNFTSDSHDESNIQNKNESDNYYLYETIDDKSIHGKTSKSEVEKMIKNENFYPIESKFSNHIKDIVIKTNLYTMSLTEKIKQIEKLEESKNIKDLFI
jgi:predicted NACHT family NTPase